MNNSIFKQQLQRYIDGELDTIYEELPKMTMQQQQQQQPMHQHQQHHKKHQEPIMQPHEQQRYAQTMHPVYSPYNQDINEYHRPQEQHYPMHTQENINDIYGIEYIDKHNNDNEKKLAAEIAQKILKTQTKVDYYKAMKKKASIKLEEHLKRKDNDCEPLIQILSSGKIENVIHDGHKLTLVNGKNKKYIKITKLK